MALREVIKLHGNTAGISIHTPPNKVMMCLIKKVLYGRFIFLICSVRLLLRHGWRMLALDYCVC